MICFRKNKILKGKIGNTIVSAKKQRLKNLKFQQIPAKLIPTVVFFIIRTKRFLRSPLPHIMLLIRYALAASVFTAEFVARN